MAQTKDSERILTSMAFRRLAKITQVVGADERYIFHNRLTHSLQVGLTARKIAERLCSSQKKLVEEIAIDPDVAEAAGLAHDLGHPPFGHVGEDELNDLVKGADLTEGFEGNAQSFRIVSRLEAFLGRESDLGLNLTSATLNALLKHPFLDTSGKAKYDAYSTEVSQFVWARRLSLGDQRSAEAESMDWADDISYAIHDMADFYRAGLIPLHLLASSKYDSERRRFFDELFNRPENTPHYKRKDLEKAFEEIILFFTAGEPFNGSHDHRLMLNQFTSVFLDRYIGGFCIDRSRNLKVEPEFAKEILMLKQLTWHYVIHARSLATHQYGLRKIIRGLFEILCDAARKPKLLRVLPVSLQETIVAAQRQEDAPSITRAVRDLVAGMTERETVDLYHRLSGVRPGSAFDYFPG